MSQIVRYQKGSKANAFRSKYPNTPLGQRFKKKQTIPRSLVMQTMSTAPEKKNLDVFAALTTLAGGAWSLAVLLNDTTSGNGPSGRLGRSFTMTSLQLRYNLARTGSNGPSQARIVVIYDKQPTGALPVALDIFSSDTSVSPINLANSERFIVIMDELTDSFQSTSLNISGNRFRKIGLSSIWTTGGTGITGVKTGAVYLIAANNDKFGGVVSVDMDFYTRIRYIDN